MTKHRGSRVVVAILAIMLFISLWMNYRNDRKQARVHQWKHDSYNWFVAGVVGGAYSLGYGGVVSHEPNLAAVDVGEAAMALEQMAAYQDVTQTGTTPEWRDQYSFQSPPHVEDVEHYLSYVAKIMANPNNAFRSGDVADGEKYILIITKLLFNEAAGKGKALSDIPDSKAALIFTQMYNLIPKPVSSQYPGPVQRFSLP